MGVEAPVNDDAPPIDPMQTLFADPEPIPGHDISNPRDGDNTSNSAPTNPSAGHHRVTVEEVPDEGDGLPRSPWVEDFPSPAAYVSDFVGTYFEGIHRKKEDAKQIPWFPFATEDEWELAQWLATSGLSQGAFDRFLKLRIVRDPRHAPERSVTYTSIDRPANALGCHLRARISFGRRSTRFPESLAGGRWRS